MAAAQLDVILEENSNFVQTLIYYDYEDNLVDISNYGAYLVFSESLNKPPFLKGGTAEGWIVIQGTSGTIIIDIPFEEFKNIDVQEGFWQLYIHRAFADPTDRPKRLVEGRFTHSRALQ